MLCSIGKREVAEIWEVLKDEADIEVLQLGDYEAEDFVPGSIKLLDNLVQLHRGPEVLKESLNVSLNVSLLVAVAVLVALDIHSFHFFAFFVAALVLPVEFKVDVASHRGDRQVPLSQFHNFLFDVLILHALKFRIAMEVLGHDLVG